MKFRHKKLMISGTAVTLAGVLGVGALLHSSISVQASSQMMPGIEKIIDETTKEDPFRILEIVDSYKDAEIGWYVSGQEPYVKLYEYTGYDREGNPVTVRFSSLEEGLSKLPTATLRREFASNVKLDENGTIIPNGTNLKDVSAYCDHTGQNADAYPIGYTEYQETYFPTEDQQSWTRVDFADGAVRTDEISGRYVEISDGTGDYSTEQQEVYPVREGIEKDLSNPELFRENIRNFYYSETDEGSAAGGDAPWFPVFQEVTNKSVNEAIRDENDRGQKSILPEYDYANGKYGYYENVYTELTEEIVQNLLEGIYTFPGENPTLIRQQNQMISGLAPLETAEAFDAGDGQVFSEAAEEFAPAEIIQEETISGGGDLFGDGVFSDEPQQESHQEPQYVMEAPVVEIMPEEEAEELYSAGVTENPVTAGTQTNPWIYRADSMEEFPYINYTLLGDLEYIKKQVQQSSVSEGVFSDVPEITHSDGDISIENGLYVIWVRDAFTGIVSAQNLYLVTGRQSVAYEDIHTLPDDLSYNYYYKIVNSYFCCRLSGDGEASDHEAYEYYGWYFSTYPVNEEIYLPVTEGQTATHYRTEPVYHLTPGIGNYQFIPGAADAEENAVHTVEVNHLYYTGGYTNHDWLKRYVFHLTPDEGSETAGEFASFRIQVDTKTVEEMEGTPSQVSGMVSETMGDLVAIDGSTFMDGEVSDTFTDAEAFSSGQETSGDGIFGSEDTYFASDSAFSSGESDFEESGDPEAVLFASGEEPSSISIEDYDLIYINGKISGKTADQIAQSGIPCIINQDKAKEQSMAGTGAIYEAFASYLKENDADGHYVSRIVYFFNNRNAQEAGLPQGLFSTFFAYNFNSSTDDTICEEALGFEEILEYIQSENQYRELGSNSSTDGIGDGSEGGTLATEPLSTELSHARAVEYILNYQYRRVQKGKDTIHVLEIQPGFSDGQLMAEQINEWLSGKDGFVGIQEITTCCWQNSGSEGDGSYMIDGNKNTIWHSAYNANGVGYQHSSASDGAIHWIEITLNKPSSISGLTYLRRQDGYQNGIPKNYVINLYDAYGNQVGDTIIGMLEDPANRQLREIVFEKKAERVKKIRFGYLDSYGDNGKHASCAEIGLLTDSQLAAEVTIDRMTAAEFVGHIDDLNTLYDLIYIGDDIKANYRTKELNGEGSLLYAHMGAPAQDKSGNSFYLKLMGMLDIDYEYTEEINLKCESTGKEADYDGQGSLRGSGNDITRQQYLELKAFAESGYPVVLGSSLLTEDGKVNEETVDNSSWYYMLLDEIRSYENVTSISELSNGNADLSFFLKLAKPVIQFQEKPPEPPRAGEIASEENGLSYLTGEGLEFEFQIANDTDALPASVTYDCELFLDLNFDGNLSDQEEQAKYMEILDESGQVVLPENGRYQLAIGRTYRLRRKIPMDYYKLITWKVKVTSNRNPNIWCSEIGYAKRNPTSPELKNKIDVLQVMPAKKIKASWNLSTDTQLKEMLDNLTDFSINITAMTEIEFKNAEDPLAGIEMLILGFDDVYPNIDEERVKDIKEFIKSGRSVIFSHDTTSYVNWDYPALGKATQGDLLNLDRWLINDKKKWDWGYQLNRQMRSLVGMDRYGITYDDTEIADNMTIGSLIRSGTPLSSETTDFTKLLDEVGDIAFSSGSSRTRSNMQTQGYTNSLLQYKTNQDTGTASKVNDGAITQYPYRIGDSLSVASTHGQYYQLALEKDRDINGISDGRNDIVVWYCLDKGVYSNSPNDVRNQYYFYSMGNVIYTGVGHSNVSNKKEKELFVNAIVAAANVTAVEPDVTFVKSLNPAAEQETTRYYMTDQAQWLEGTGNVLQKNMEFYINVQDYNMVSSSLSLEDQKEQKMIVEFYIEDENGQTVEPESWESLPEDVKGKKLTNISSRISKLHGFEGDGMISAIDGKFYLPKNDAYGFTFYDIEQYLRDTTQGYRKNCKLYVRVTSTVSLYGSLVSKTAWKSLDLKQRQLFDLD